MLLSEPIHGKILMNKIFKIIQTKSLKLSTFSVLQYNYFFLSKNSNYQCKDP